MEKEIDPETLKSLHRADFEFHSHDARRRLDYADQYGQSALKSLFLVNGGSIIALLTFIGNTHTEIGERGIFWAFLWFCMGLSSVLLAYFGAYFSQNFYFRQMVREAASANLRSNGFGPTDQPEDDARTGTRFLLLAVIAAIGSFGFFFAGALVSVVAIT